MTGGTPSLPLRSRVVLVTLYSGATVVMLLVAFRILTGLAYLMGLYVAFGLLIFGAFLNFRWMAETR